MDDTIKLDRRSFEALAADSRVRILKSLAQRRKTLTELAKELGLSNSTMKEHLDVLVRAGLIIQRDEGRKWKYYDLTRKGQGIVNPYPTKVLIMLAVSLLLVIGSGWNFIGAYGTYSLEETEGAPAILGADAIPAMEASVEMAGGEPAAASPMELTSEDEFIEAEEAPLSYATKGALEENEHAWIEEAEPSPAAMQQEFPWRDALLLAFSVCLLVVSVYYLTKR
ncbi:MAG: winged helix-turn-helix transcriptional regulator [bacterium]|nr:winged helix-turn-helix transcriptional regulator [bacterium]